MVEGAVLPVEAKTFGITRRPLAPVDAADVRVYALGPVARRDRVFVTFTLQRPRAEPFPPWEQILVEHRAREGAGPDGLAPLDHAAARLVRDPRLRVTTLRTCPHLQPLERHLRAAGVPLFEFRTYTDDAEQAVGWWLATETTLDRRALEAAGVVSPDVIYLEYGMTAASTVQFACRACRSAIEGRHPDAEARERAAAPRPPGGPFT